MKKKSVNYLKILRVVLALVFTLPMLLYCLDSWQLIPSSVHYLLHIQFVPALMCAPALGISAWLVITLLFGRIYCSTICPAGILQDVFIRLKKKRYTYHRPQNLIRYALLFVVVSLALTSTTSLLILLDPYSNFGRICANVLRPIVILVNNLLAEGLATVGNYSLYHITLQYISISSFTIALTAFLVFLVMSISRGRLFCNTLCPVGATLSLVSFKPMFAIAFDEDKCNKCGKCQRACKSECIDSKQKKVDNSRCVLCFNCVSSCSQGAMEYRYNYRSKKKPNKIMQEHTKPDESNSRRTFIQSAIALTLSSSLIPKLLKANNKESVDQKLNPITPPGSQDLAHFEKTCTACHLCVVKCPNQTLKPVGLAYGIDYFLKPEMRYDKSYCNYECTICSNVCPTGALQPLTVAEKKITQIGIAKFERERCVTITDGTDCGACSEHCPTQAVRMIPLKGSLRMPEVDPDICIGCGGCEQICPVKPNKAIHIVANVVHKTAETPDKGPSSDKKVNDFGF